MKKTTTTLFLISYIITDSSMFHSNRKEKIIGIFEYLPIPNELVRNVSHLANLLNGIEPEYNVDLEVEETEDTITTVQIKFSVHPVYTT